MQRLGLSLVALVALSVAVPALPVVGDAFGVATAAAKAKPGLKDPESVIRAIYAQYSKEAGPAEAQQQYFSGALYQLWIDVQRGANGVDDVGIDFDVFLNAVDLDTVTIASTKFTADGSDKGKVDVAFTASAKKTAIGYLMVKTAKGWKIDNIMWGGKHGNLREMLTAIRSKQAPTQ